MFPLHRKEVSPKVVTCNSRGEGTTDQVNAEFAQGLKLRYERSERYVVRLIKKEQLRSLYLLRKLGSSGYKQSSCTHRFSGCIEVIIQIQPFE